jgi:hypothetical protein
MSGILRAWSLQTFCCLRVWVTALVVSPTLAAKRGSLLRRTRSLIKELTGFVNDNEGNVSAIHHNYDAKFRLRNSLMVMFTLYFDDSGTHAKSEVAVAGCYIATVEQWSEFKRNWQEANVREHFGTFAVRLCTAMVDRWRKRNKHTGPIQYVFDRMSKGKAI